jgi:hypothetical protein
VVRIKRYLKLAKGFALDIPGASPSADAARAPPNANKILVTATITV